MLEEVLIRHSAPTLAGLKTANLFWYSWESKEEFENSAELWKRVLKEKGLSLTAVSYTHLDVYKRQRQNHCGRSESNSLRNTGNH